MNKTRTNGEERAKRTETSNRRGLENPAQQREIVPVADWEAEVYSTRQGREHAGLRRKVTTKGIKSIDVADLFDEVKLLMRRGYEIRLRSQRDGEGLRLFPCLDADYSGMFIAAQTMGAFRKAIEDIPFRMQHRGEEIDPKAASVEKERKSAEKKQEARQAVTPDTLVTCPECGCEFRVGKELS